MKKIITLFLIFIYSYSFSQDFGSGTITITTSDGLLHPISIKASDLFINPNAVTSVSGNTNEPIPFGPWIIPETLNINDQDSEKINFTIYKNPSSELYVDINTNERKNISARVLDINGSIVSVPNISFNGETVILTDPLSNVSTGLYFIQIYGEINHTFKFIKNHIPISKPVSKEYYTSYKTASEKAVLVNENYRLIWASNDVVDGEKNVEIIKGTNNNIIIQGDLAWVGKQSGDVLISTNPTKYNTKITLTNTITPDSSYTISPSLSYAIFWNIYVSDSNNPTSYRVDIMSNEADPDFLPTTTFLNIFQDVAGEINGSKTVNLTPIPNEVDLTIIVRHYQTTATMAGVTVELYNANTNALIDSQVSDANGAVVFNNVLGETSIYTVIDKADDSIYKKTNESITTILVNTISKMTDTINTTAVPKVFFADASQVPISTVMDYKVQEYNVEFLRYSDEIYIADSPEKPVVIGHLQNFATGVGYPNGFDFSATQPFNAPTATQDSQYQIFLPNRVTFDGLVGTNSAPVGTATTTSGKLADNGKQITYWAGEFNLGGLEENRNHHEAGNKLNIPLLPGTTSRNASAGASVTLTETDAKMIQLWYNLGDNIYIKVDAANRPLDYSHTSLLEN